MSEFLDAAAAKKADDDWTMDEVLLGQDGGGDAAGAPALGAAAAGGLPAGGTARERSRRLKTTVTPDRLLRNSKLLHPTNCVSLYSRHRTEHSLSR